MAQMKARNEQLKKTLGMIPAAATVTAAQNIPDYDGKNRQGYDAYALEDELRLLSMLNTVKLEPQYYRSESETLTDLKDLVWKLGQKDAYFVAQSIVWSRCLGEGMRSVNHLAAALLAPFAAGTDWGRRFYGPFDKKTKTGGGCVYRLDDMSEIKDAFSALNKSPLTNAMKKGFASALLSAGPYELAKYSKTVIDITNLVHPDVSKSKATVTLDGKEVNVIDALMKGQTIPADTWERANSEAGQIVAEAVKTGKLSQEKAKEVLAQAKNDNWEDLLKEGKLGILAAVRNLRNILDGDSRSVIDLVCNLVQDGGKIRDGKVMPYQLELAMTAVQEFDKGKTATGRQVLDALERGMVTALPNLRTLLTGRNLVIVDCSGSMTWHAVAPDGKSLKASCLDKAAILAAMLAKGANADIIVFGSNAQRLPYNPGDSLTTIAAEIKKNELGGTNISSAFDLITGERVKYDRIFLLSDNEANRGCTRSSYKSYVQQVCSPYVYCVDLAAYGSRPLKNDGKVNYYYGYGYSMLDDVARLEFKPEAHIERVRKIII
ncbi:MAG: VWA domain-containing protein [Prevotella sp.]|nr:VWA domain-containing protein [Prevotella sp.]